MKPLIYFILLSILLSCSKASLNKICDVDDPITELGWLADKIADANANSQKIKVSKVILKLNKREEGFIIQTGFWSILISGYYNCNGEVLCTIGGVVGNLCDKYKILKEEELYRNY